MLATNVAKCSRADQLRTSPDGYVGELIKK